MKQVPKVRGVREVQLDPLDLGVSLVCLVREEHLVARDLRVSKVKLDSLVSKDRKDLQDHWDLQDLLEKGDPLEKQEDLVSQVWLVDLESLEGRVREASVVPVDSQDPKVQLVHRARQDPGVNKDHVGREDLKDLKVALVSTGSIKLIDWLFCVRVNPLYQFPVRLKIGLYTVK